MNLKLAKIVCNLIYLVGCLFEKKIMKLLNELK